MKSLASSAAVIATLLSFSTFAAPSDQASVTATTNVVSEAAKLPIPNNPFHFRAGLSGPFHPANGVTGAPNGFGIGAVVEPSFAFTDWLALGIRVDAAIIAAIGISSGVSVGLSVPVATHLKLEIGLPTTVRPFLGVGVGPYFLVNLSASGGSGGAGAGILQGTFWGASPQVGIDFGGFRLAALYHYLPALRSANYFALELSWRT